MVRGQEAAVRSSMQDWPNRGNHLIQPTSFSEVNLDIHHHHDR